MKKNQIVWKNTDQKVTELNTFSNECLYVSNKLVDILSSYLTYPLGRAPSSGWSVKGFKVVVYKNFFQSLDRTFWLTQMGVLSILFLSIKFI